MIGTIISTGVFELQFSFKGKEGNLFKIDANSDKKKSISPNQEKTSKYLKEQYLVITRKLRKLFHNYKTQIFSL